MPSRILPCSCKHEFQDSRYGVGNRVMNQGRSANAGEGRWRCTVCAKVHVVAAGRVVREERQ